jgi:hypothetical protein
MVYGEPTLKKDMMLQFEEIDGHYPYQFLSGCAVLTKESRIIKIN